VWEDEYVLADEAVPALAGSVVVLEQRVLPELVDLVELGLAEDDGLDAHGVLEVEVDPGLALHPFEPVEFGGRLSDLLLLEEVDDVLDVLGLRLKTGQLLQLALHLQLVAFAGIQSQLGDGGRGGGVILAEYYVLNGSLVLHPFLQFLEDWREGVVATLNLFLQPADLLADLHRITHTSSSP
jgi:hypothetical protein